jgi:uncharacterized cupredoxin-like copper-binding protein
MKRALLVLSVIAVLVAVGCSSGSNGSNEGSVKTTAETVKIDMVDTAFKPHTVEVHRGEAVRFVFANKGKVDHDAVIGDAAAQVEHEREMRSLEAEGHSAEHGGGENAITVMPGDTGELTTTFNRVGFTEIGCHEVGHYEAGMRVTVNVV